MKAKRTWIIIADGAHARVFETRGSVKKLTPVEDMTMDGDHRATHDILTERPGRTNESVGPMRHAIEPATDPRRELKRSFAQSVADRLERRYTDKSFDRFVLVAPPKTLGDLRSALSPALRAALHGEVAKDLVKTPQIEISDHLNDIALI
jgi:protein required for attachment to host cells